LSQIYSSKLCLKSKNLKYLFKIKFYYIRFHVYSWLFNSINTSNLDPSQQIMMLESALITLCAIIGFQPNIGRRKKTANLFYKYLIIFSSSCSRN